MGKMFCDDQFADCLINQCMKLTRVRAHMCKWDVFGMSSAVKLLGNKFYCTKGRSSL